MPKLKPCPFCGSAVAMMVTPSGDWYWIQCLATRCAICPETSQYETEAEAARAWNRRPK